MRVFDTFSTHSAMEKGEGGKKVEENSSKETEGDGLAVKSNNNNIDGNDDDNCETLSLMSIGLASLPPMSFADGVDQLVSEHGRILGARCV